MMSDPGPNPQEAPTFGDYRVGRLVSEGARTRTYEAEQISVRRKVLLERLKPGGTEDEETREGFLADIRAKAAVDHPVIGSVFEAAQRDGVVFYVREFLQGNSLEQLHEAGTELDPRRLASVLCQVGEAIHHLDDRQVTRLALEPRHLFLGHHDVLRIVNLAVAGQADPVVAAHERQMVSELLLDLLAAGRPGSTRLRKLLTMLGGDDPPTWHRIAHTSRKLADEFSENARSSSQAEVSVRPGEAPPGGRPGWLAPLVLSLVVLGALAAGGMFLLKREVTPKPRDLSAMVRVTGASVLGPAAEKILIPAYWLDAHEVTIAEYAEFLAALAVIGEAQRDVYDHRAQPRHKTSHKPDDWTAMHAAATRGGQWNELPVTLNCPVVNVDWWDAYAFANWRGGRLPTLEEWLAAAGSAPLAVSDWGEVDAAPADRTPNAIHGLAGNVSEWVRDSGLNPAFPMNPKAPMACGASYQHPRNGIIACTWLASRESRRPDLGFRILRTSPP
jgi:hypothetical protein